MIDTEAMRCKILENALKGQISDTTRSIIINPNFLSWLPFLKEKHICFYTIRIKYSSGKSENGMKIEIFQKFRKKRLGTQIILILSGLIWKRRMNGL